MKELTLTDCIIKW